MNLVSFHDKYIKIVIINYIANRINEFEHNKFKEYFTNMYRYSRTIPIWFFFDLVNIPLPKNPITFTCFTVFLSYYCILYFNKHYYLENISSEIKNSHANKLLRNNNLLIKKFTVFVLKTIFFPATIGLYLLEICFKIKLIENKILHILYNILHF